MPLPTLTKTWNYNVNNIYLPSANLSATYASLWYRIKNLFVTSGLWTVIASSNGTTVNTGDNWTSGSALNPLSSWIILQHPANGSQLSITLANDGGGGHWYILHFSKSGWNVSGTLSLTTPPVSSPNVAGDSLRYPIVNGLTPWGGGLAANNQHVHHYMWSSDGYCHRHIIYYQDFPVLGIFLETPDSLVPQWSTSGLPSYAMFVNSGTPANGFTVANVYRTAGIHTRISAVGSVGASNLYAYLTGEALNTNGASNGLISEYLNIPNDFTGEYPMLETGIFTNTLPYLTKLGKPFDLWYGVADFLGSVTYPNDNSRQFASHGCLITPWNGSVMLTR